MILSFLAFLASCCVLIHSKVVAEEKTFGYQGAVTRQKWKTANIVFVGDYVEAACHAYKHGLIQVCDETKHERREGQSS